jgi:hypothetical protein
MLILDFILGIFDILKGNITSKTIKGFYAYFVMTSELLSRFLESQILNAVPWHPSVWSYFKVYIYYLIFVWYIVTISDNYLHFRNDSTQVLGGS